MFAKKMTAYMMGAIWSLGIVAAAGGVRAEEPTVPVTIDNFVRAETDMYFAKMAGGTIGKFVHSREMAPIDKQDVVRMNRDTIYSSGLFDLDAGPVTIVLPDAGTRFMSMMVVSQDHYVVDVAYAPGKYRYTKDDLGTRYMLAIIRTLANPRDAADMKAAHTAQDGIKVEQASAGSWEAPNWDPVSQKKIRDALAELGSTMAGSFAKSFGTKDEVDPIHHMIGTAIGWGGNPRTAADYDGFYPEKNDGKTAYSLTVKDVPVDGFWSISVYNADGFFEANPQNAYSVNNVTAKANKDGSVTIHFGGDPKAANYIAIMPGWNYVVRMYRPRKEILDGTWKFPEAKPVM